MIDFSAINASQTLCIVVFLKLIQTVAARRKALIQIAHKGRLRFCREKDALLEEYAVVSCTRAQLADLPAEAVCGAEESPYGARALVKRALVSPAFSPEPASVEDVILYLVKGEKRK